MLKEFWNRTKAKFELEEIQFQSALEVYREKYRRYEAASFGKRTMGWDRTNRGAVADHTPSLRNLRGTSRDLVRNNPYAKRAVEVIASNIIGSGIQPAFMGKTTLLNQVKTDWRRWAGKTVCDFNENLNFYGIQKQVIRAVVESGDALIVKRMNREATIPYELQVLESDFLDETKTEDLGEEGFILQGVHFNKNGKRKGYWIFDKHPGELLQGSLQSRFVSKEFVTHVFEVLRPGQVRGIPFGVSCFVRLKDFDEYQDYQLYKQKVAACFVMVVTDQVNPNGALVKKKDDDEDYINLDKMGPGIIEYLPEGRDVKFSQPPSVDGYGEYTKTVLQGIAAGYGITYEALTNDYSNVNFSSGRMGWIEFQRNVEGWQNDIAIPFCDKVFSWFSEGLALRSPLLKINTIEVTWTTPRREMIDPLKEGTAMINLTRAGFVSRQENQRQLGYDPDDVLSEHKEDFRLADAIGAKFESDPRYDPAREKAEAKKNILAEPKK